MVKTIEIRPFMDGTVAKSWWQWALIGVIAASGGIGMISVVWFLVKSLIRYSKVCELHQNMSLLTFVVETKRTGSSSTPNTKAFGRTLSRNQDSKLGADSQITQADHVRCLPRRISFPACDRRISHTIRIRSTRLGPSPSGRSRTRHRSVLSVAAPCCRQAGPISNAELRIARKRDFSSEVNGAHNKHY
jgi:hypothetical protein